jgi:hypothetical protein
VVYRIHCPTPVYVVPGNHGKHDINAVDRFENLLSDRLADGPTIEVEDLIEQGAWEDFVRKHPNITAYFHRKV